MVALFRIDYSTNRVQSPNKRELIYRTLSISLSVGRIRLMRYERVHRPNYPRNVFNTIKHYSIISQQLLVQEFNKKSHFRYFFFVFNLFFNFSFVKVYTQYLEYTATHFFSKQV